MSRVNARCNHNYLGEVCPDSLGPITSGRNTRYRARRQTFGLSRLGLNVMQLEENLFTGHHEDYYWMVATREIRNRGDIVTAFFPNKYCHITSFDSGPISPGPDELSAGWESAHNIMVSPALTDQLDIPYDQYDEWYILETRDFPVKEPEVFVNYGGFTLIEIDTLNKNDDPTWDYKRWDFLKPLQERFWLQIRKVDPIAYISSGGVDIVVSKEENFVNEIRDTA